MSESERELRNKITIYNIYKYIYVQYFTSFNKKNNFYFYYLFLNFLPPLVWLCSQVANHFENLKNLILSLRRANKNLFAENEI